MDFILWRWNRKFIQGFTSKQQKNLFWTSRTFRNPWKWVSRRAGRKSCLQTICSPYRKRMWTWTIFPRKQKSSYPKIRQFPKSASKQKTCGFNTDKSLSMLASSQGYFCVNRRFCSTLSRTSFWKYFGKCFYRFTRRNFWKTKKSTNWTNKLRIQGALC